jgi:hypothetical protein
MLNIKPLLIVTKENRTNRFKKCLPAKRDRLWLREELASVKNKI